MVSIIELLSNRHVGRIPRQTKFAHIYQRSGEEDVASCLGQERTYPMSNFTSKLVVTVEVKLQIIKQPKLLFIQKPLKLN